MTKYTTEDFFCDECQELVSETHSCFLEEDIASLEQKLSNLRTLVEDARDFVVQAVETNWFRKEAERWVKRAKEALDE